MRGCWSLLLLKWYMIKSTKILAIQIFFFLVLFWWVDRLVVCVRQYEWVWPEEEIKMQLLGCCKWKNYDDWNDYVAWKSWLYSCVYVFCSLHSLLLRLQSTRIKPFAHFSHVSVYVWAHHLNQVFALIAIYSTPYHPRKLINNLIIGPAADQLIALLDGFFSLWIETMLFWCDIVYTQFR